jgi:hypothetical protein
MKITHLAAVLVGMSFVPSLVSSRAYALDPRIFQAEKAAVGGETWRHVAVIRFSGKIIAGDAPGSFTETIDHRNGHSLMVTDTGSLHDESGFDGAIWDKQNGIVTLADLPSLLADAETQAFVNRDGWWGGSDLAEMKLLAAKTEAGSPVDGVAVTPAKGSPVDVWFDRKTHLIVRPMVSLCRMKSLVSSISIRSAMERSPLNLRSGEENERLRLRSLPEMLIKFLLTNSVCDAS